MANTNKCITRICIDTSITKITLTLELRSPTWEDEIATYKEKRNNSEHMISLTM